MTSEAGSDGKAMRASVSLDELQAAVEWVSAGEVAALDSEAFVSRATGQILWVGEGIDEEPPEDIEDEDLYLPVPGKSEFDLGRPVALRFVAEHLPAELETVQMIFRKRGAFSRFKALRAQAGLLDAWHAHEQSVVEAALREWCEDNDLDVVP
ncbi:hypothetical protein [Piscinibacter sakaiensis]|uniref:hypothetical protein n=1 Tax=Piscinibacter sakaiensis TaxID=1547922 RepID=UPI003AAA24DB